MIRLCQALTMTCIVWGALAFGSTYRWASRPLAVLAILSGVLMLIRMRRRPGTSPFLAAGAILTGLAIALQLRPLPADVLASWSPATVAFLRQYDVAFAAASGPHPISVDPDMTQHALLLYVSFAIFFAGLVRLLSATGARWLAQSIGLFAVVMALIGIVQKPLTTKIYGVWDPHGGSLFGPFINRNHFAGWMMMALPLALALLCAAIEKGMRGVRPVWRDRLLWLGSPEASRLLLRGVAVFVMGLALVLTMSKFGIFAFMFALVLTGGFVVAGVSANTRRAVATAYLAVLFLVVVGWVGLDAIAHRFEQANWEELGDRRGVWDDAERVVNDFPVLGTGINTFGRVMLLYQQHDLTLHTAQAHNDYLQLLAEGGLLVTIPAALTAVAFVVVVARRFREGHAGVTAWWLRAGAVAGIVAVALQEIVDFSLQMPGNAVLFMALCAIAVHRPPRRHHEAHEGHEEKTWVRR